MKRAASDNGNDDGDDRVPPLWIVGGRVPDDTTPREYNRRLLAHAKRLIARGLSVRAVTEALPPLCADFNLRELHYRQHFPVVHAPDIILLLAPTKSNVVEWIVEGENLNLFRVNVDDPAGSLQRNYMNETTLLLENIDHDRGRVNKACVELLETLDNYACAPSWQYAGVKLCARRVYVTTARHPNTWRGTDDVNFEEIFTRVEEWEENRWSYDTTQYTHDVLTSIGTNGMHELWKMFWEQHLDSSDDDDASICYSSSSSLSSSSDDD